MSDGKDSKPPQDAQDGSELSDEELDPVAGGARNKPPVTPPSPPGGPLPIPYPLISDQRVAHRHFTASRISVAGVQIGPSGLHTR